MFLVKNEPQQSATAGTLEAILCYVQMYMKIVNRQLFIASSNFLMSAILTTLAHTSLHLLLLTLFVQRGCEIDARNDRNQTPLHIAILRGHSKILERLVGYGAGVNTLDEDGNNPLLMVLSVDAMEPPSDDTPELKKVYAHLCTSNFSVVVLLAAC